ncbi:MAG: 30S ribosomal protein S20 [Candidatus Hydrogenedentes bacterium]|nr:30S ribosomal protein S20 [Candidatus Hydrogenedentota bacterium]
MPVIKSQKKRVLTNEKRRQRNVAVRTRVKTYLKRVETAIDQNDAKKIDEAVKAALSEIDVAERKGVYHKNNAARKKSRLYRRAEKAKTA